MIQQFNMRTPFLYAVALCVVKQIAGVLLGTADLLFLNVLAVDIASGGAGSQRKQRDDKRQ